MNKEKILERLNKITSNTDFIHILCVIVLNDFCGTLNELSTKNVRESLNNNEVKFLMGLWIKNWHSIGETGYDDESKTFDEIYELME